MKNLYSVKIFKNLVFDSFLILFLLIASLEVNAKGTIIPTDASQQDFIKAYKMVMTQSGSDYRFTSTTIDTNLFPDYGEYSVYWVRTDQTAAPSYIPMKFLRLLQVLRVIIIVSTTGSQPSITRFSLNHRHIE